MTTTKTGRTTQISVRLPHEDDARLRRLLGAIAKTWPDHAPAPSLAWVIKRVMDRGMLELERKHGLRGKRAKVKRNETQTVRTVGKRGEA